MGVDMDVRIGLEDKGKRLSLKLRVDTASAYYCVPRLASRLLRAVLCAAGGRKKERPTRKEEKKEKAMDWSLGMTDGRYQGK